MIDDVESQKLYNGTETQNKFDFGITFNNIAGIVSIKPQVGTGRIRPAAPAAPWPSTLRLSGRTGARRRRASAGP